MGLRVEFCHTLCLSLIPWAPLRHWPGQKMTPDSFQGCVVTGRVPLRNIAKGERSGGVVAVQIRHGPFVRVGNMADI